ncbi:MAG: efflux RND transporter periplasmic adaptor subunit [Bacteroidales bacterium]|nr:efflux RND transporter periplasmic adaptor subunit [Bacteroidales bacterium]
MKKLTFILLPALVLAASCSKPVTEANAEPVAEIGDTTVYLVKTMQLEKQSVARSIGYTSNLLAFEEINYAPAQPGRIEQINVEVGSRVRQGDVIVKMDRTQLLQANEQLQNARITFERMDTLRKLNSISEQQYDAAKTQYEVLKANVDFLNRNTALVSPINGIVTGKYFEAGELYSGAPNTAAGKAAIVTLMQINPLKAKVNVSEKYFPLVKNGMKAAVTVDIYSDKKFTGEIFRVYPVISPETRTFTVELSINNANELLRPGMFARVSLDLGETTALILPASAILKQEGTNDRYIFLTNGDNTARRVPVNIGDRFDDKLEVLSSEIKEGDTVIIAGQEKLLNGSKIKIVQ